MSEYKLSIIVPTFNLENIIDKTFNSIKKQTFGFDKIELIFVDDCSTDNTLKIITRYETNFNNVKVFKTEENSGFGGKPRNLGIENSTADYVIFLDGDDQLLVDSCAILYDSITNSNTDIVIGGHINRYSDERLEHIPPMYFGRNEIFKEVIDSNLFKIQPAIGAKLFKKDLLIKNNIRFPEGISGQDLVFLLNSMINSNKINVLNNFYVYYRSMRNDSVTFNFNENYFYGLIEAYTLICDLFKKYDINYDIQEMLFTEHLMFFTKQINRAKSSNDIENNTIHTILNSEKFKILANKEIFKKNPIFEEYFNNMVLGNYDNQKLLKKIFDNLKPEIRNEYSFLKEYNNTLTEKNQKLNEKQNILQDKINNLNKNIEDKNNENRELIDNIDKINEELIKKDEKIIDLEKNFNSQINLNNEIKMKYNNTKILQNRLSTENDQLTQNNSKIREENNILQQHNTKITKENNELKDKLTTLTELVSNFKINLDELKTMQNCLIDENVKLLNENKKINEELDEIKSSRLWKIKNKF